MNPGVLSINLVYNPLTHSVVFASHGFVTLLAVITITIGFE